MAGHVARRAGRRILARYANTKWLWRLRDYGRRADDAMRNVSARIRHARGNVTESWRIGRAVGRPIAISIALAAGALWATAALDSHVGINWKIDGGTYDVLFE